MKAQRHIRLDALLSASVLSLMATAGWSQTLIWLGTLGGNSSTAYDVSNDGVVVGQAANSAGQGRAFRWQNGVMTDLGTLGGANSGAYAVTPDGRIVVGYAQNRQGRDRAFRWTLGVGMADLGTLGGNTGSSAYAVSDNGNTVVGGSDVSTGRPVIKPFIWENNQMTRLDIGDLFTRAFGVSGLGDLVAISSLSDFLPSREAFVWNRQSNSAIQLPHLPGAGESQAYAISNSGTTVVGASYDASGSHAVRWDRSGSQFLVTALDPQRNIPSSAQGVSQNGGIIVGAFSDSQNRSYAFRWLRTRHLIENLNTEYASLLRDGSILRVATSVSPNGRYIVGWGYNARTRRNEAFLLDTQVTCQSHNGDVNRDGCVDDADLLQVLFAFGNTGSNLGRTDINCDGTVDDADLLIVLFNFGNCRVKPGIYIPDRDALRGVMRYDPNDNSVQRFGGCAQVYYYGIDVSPEGKIYLVRHASSRDGIDVIGNNAQCNRFFPAPSGVRPRGIAVHPSGLGQKWAAIATDRGVYLLRQSDGNWNGPLSPPGAWGIAWDDTGGYLYAHLDYVDQNGIRINELVKYEWLGDNRGISAERSRLTGTFGITDIDVVGTRLYAACTDGFVRIYDAEDLRLVSTLGPVANRALLHGVEIDQFGTLWVTEYNSGKLYRFDGASFVEAAQIGNTKVGSGMAIVP